MTGVAEIERQVELANRVQSEWGRTPAAERAAALRAGAVALRAHADELAELNHAETGRPQSESKEGVLAGAATLEQYAELGPVQRGKSLQGDYEATDFMVWEPRCVVVALTPWNDPVAVPCGLLGAALATGNTVVHKPSERAPHTGGLLGDLLAGTPGQDAGTRSWKGVTGWPAQTTDSRLSADHRGRSAASSNGSSSASGSRCMSTRRGSGRTE